VHVSAEVIAKAATTFLSNEKIRRDVGWVLVVILSPFILIVAFLCALASGEAQHNVSTVEACFYGTALSEEAPAELNNHIREMQTAFSLLDSAVSYANMQMEDGGSLDPIRVKAVFLALCFGEDAPGRRAAGHFVDCFYTTEEATREVETKNEDGDIITEEESYTRTLPLPFSQAYTNLEALLGRQISEDDYENIRHIYSMIAGDMGDWTYDGEYSFMGGDYSTELDVPAAAADPNKTAAGLAAYAIYAYESGWGYALRHKAAQPHVPNFSD